MKRREFIAGLGSAAAWAEVARAQQAMMPFRSAPPRLRARPQRKFLYGVRHAFVTS
jgi:hypothetical protein